MHELLEYILPVVFSSGEAMIGLMIFVILFIVGRGKLLPSERVLVIKRKGRYNMVLAPGLNLAQSFIESIAERVVVGDEQPDGLLASFSVRDKHIATNKQPAYVLRVSWLDGLLHFEAVHTALGYRVESDALFLARTLEMRAKVEQAVVATANARGVDVSPI